MRGGFLAFFIDHSERAGSEAERIRSEQRFAEVVTDYHMPQMSGLEIAVATRALCADLPIALISGYVMDVEAEGAERGIFDAFVFKPSIADELCPVIERLLSTRRSAQVDASDRPL